MENAPDYRRLALAFLAASCVLYASSLLFNGFCANPDQGNCWPGWAALLIGGLDVLNFRQANVTWAANPLIFATWFAISKRKGDRAALCGFAAFALSASFLLFKEIQTGEEPIDHFIVSRGIGYWLWLSSMGCALIGAALTDNASLQPAPAIGTETRALD